MRTPALVCVSIGIATLAAGTLLLRDPSALPASVHSPVASLAPARTDAACPRGQVLHDVAQLASELRPDLEFPEVARLVSHLGERICVPRELPRTATAALLESGDRHHNPRGAVAAGAYRSAWERKQAMIASGAQQKVAGAVGTWTPYGRGPLIVNEPRYGSVNGLGLVFNAGRVDSLKYDEASGRLFAAVANAGVWVSEDLAESWRSIGDNLPTQAVGAVGYTPAGGGTVIAATGEPILLGGVIVLPGVGVYWSNDLGTTWQRASGVPDGLLSFQVAVDPAHPEIVYVANSRGLYRSTDAGRSFVNVALPVSAECAGVEALDSPCYFASAVTDVAVKVPGGTTGETCGEDGCPVLAAVGFLLSNLTSYSDGTNRAPGNGLYRSDSGAPGSFALLDASGDGTSNIGFPPQERIGRVEFGLATGPEQNHNYVYAIVQDAVLLAGGARGLDIPFQRETQGIPNSSFISGLYVSPDFGSSWLRMADTAEIANNPNTGSFFVGLQALIAAGVQAWYNMWIKPDPTRALGGVPTRLSFGLEEVWESRLTALPLDGATQSGADDFRVIGVYFAGDACLGFSLGLPGCPGRTEPVAETTTHPDQHDAVYVPQPDGGVCLIVGNDGGVYKQCVGPGEEFSQTRWGNGHNEGFNTLLPYNMAVARDGTVWYGLQDNGSGKIDPVTRKQFETFGGDGFYVAVDPRNSFTAYSETTNATMRVTKNGGVSWTTITPPVSAPNFSNPFAMDPTDANHLITAGPEVVEIVDGPEATWVEVFNLGTNPDNGAIREMTALDVHGAAAYVGACGRCVSSGLQHLGFQTWLATNVGGDAPPQKGSPDGWHLASARGLPARYITGIDIDPVDPRTVYVTLGGYGYHQLPPGRYLDASVAQGGGNVYKSTDAGETFTDISAGLPQVHATWVTLRGNQLLVGTDIGVFVSGDTQGIEWAPMGSGLPAAPVTKVEMHPGDPNTVFVSTYGRGIWSMQITDAPLPLPLVCDAVGVPMEDRERFGGAMLPAGLLVLLLAGLLQRRLQRSRGST